MKTIKKLNKQFDNTKIETYLFEIDEPEQFQLGSTMVTYKYLRGGFVKGELTNTIALYATDAKGQSVGVVPLYEDEGFNTFQEYFRHIGYVLLDSD